MALELSMVVILLFYLVDKVVTLCTYRSSVVVAELILTLALLLWTVS